MKWIMKYRSRLDIVAAILDSIGNGSKRTSIMYRAYLSHKQLNDYLDFLLSKGLIMFESETGLFKLTAEGSKAFDFIIEVEKMVGIVGRRQHEIEHVPKIVVSSE